MTTESRPQSPIGGQAMRAWQDGVNAMLTGYNRQASQLSTGAWGLRLDPTQVRESVQRIAEETREVTNAQVAVASEWMRVPFWMTGSASPTGLQKSYSRLFQAYNRLFSAYFTAAEPVREATERVMETTAKVADSQVKASREAAADITTAQAASARAATDAAVNGAAQATRASARAVDQAIEIAGEAEERAERRSHVDATTERHDRTEAPTERRDRTAVPTDRQIKGHLGSSGEKIYHIPGQSSYERTQADVTFASEEEAQAAGYRRAETPGGGKIKGKLARDGSKIYHVPGQANYDRFEADALFESEEAAEAAGFRPSQR